jgi:hypothetical protein
MRIEGIDEFKRKLADLRKRGEDLHGRHEVALNELFSPTFMARHSQVASFEELIEVSGFHVETQDDFEKIPDDSWDDIVARYTDFSDWEEMKAKALELWVAEKLGL